MKKTTYLALIEPLKAHPKKAHALITLNKAITYLIYLAYPALLIGLYVTHAAISLNPFMNETLIRSFFVPCISFVVISLLRKAINAPRPYEVFQTEPVLPKNTKGKSFPSRHVFSIFVIGATFFLALSNPAPGIVIGILGIFLAVLRVFLGVHFPRDVVAGCILGIAAGLIGFLLF